MLGFLDPDLPSKSRPMTESASADEAAALPAQAS
jgi:hypothetical protein